VRDPTWPSDQKARLVFWKGEGLTVKVTEEEISGENGRKQMRPGVMRRRRRYNTESGTKRENTNKADLAETKGGGKASGVGVIQNGLGQRRMIVIVWVPTGKRCPGKEDQQGRRA